MNCSFLYPSFTGMEMSSSTPWREILDSSILVAQRLQDDLARPSLLILHRSQWRCLARSYSAVIQALSVLLQHYCSIRGIWTICSRGLTASLHALHEAVQEGETCMRESLLPSSSNSTHSWLVKRALTLGMSTDVVDRHLHRLLWTSSVVREQILRLAEIDRMEFVISRQTRDLCEIWAHVDAQDDFLSAQILLKRIMGEEEGEPHQLASFILQKLSCAENLGRITDTDDLPPFLWVDPEALKRNPEIIGEGGFGKVQEALWLGGRFAVKDFFYVENDVAFGREATIQSQLRHPNVIPLVCCTKNPSLRKCSLVMERMQQDLKMLMMQRTGAGIDPPFPLLLGVDLMLQIAKGMEYLHSDNLHIIHRDIKSSNMLVSISNSDGVSSSYANDVSPHVHLKIADFGMSRAKDASSRYTTKQTGATPWRAPEVFEDEVGGGQPNARYTNKADVYSFGLVCYEILTGKSPFEGPRIRMRVLAGERPTLPAQCPPALSSYIERCWHAEPAERPTFTQICRMLRFFQACILLRDHDHSATEWLLHPLPTTVCARIDDMLRDQVQQCGAILRPQLLVIPLEMYCCRVVLQQQLQDQRSSTSTVGLVKLLKGYFSGIVNVPMDPLPSPQCFLPPLRLDFSEEQLCAYDGSDPSMPLLMAIRGQIYDVSESRMSYGPAGPYAVFAGKDASRALGKMSFKEEDLTGNIEDLNVFELSMLQDWEIKFMSKYDNVGQLIK